MFDGARPRLVCSAHAEVIPGACPEHDGGSGLLRTRGGNPVYNNPTVFEPVSAPHTRR